MLKVLVAVGLAVGFFLLNVLLYRLNKNTPVPEGCENLTPDCKGCGMKDCSLRKEFMRKEEDNGNR